MGNGRPQRRPGFICRSWAGESVLPGLRASLKRYVGAYRGLPRDVLLLAFSIAIPSMAWSFIDILWAPYLALIGLDEPTIGGLMMVGMMVMAVLTIPSGLLADIVGKKKVALVSSGLNVLYSLFYYLTTDLRLLYVAELLGGLAGALGWAPTSALLADKAGEKRDYAFSFFSFITSTSSFVGTLLGGLPDLMVVFMGFSLPEATRLMFLLASLLSAIGSVLLLLVEEQKRPSERPMKPFLNVKSWGIIARYGLTSALIGLGAGLVIPWFSYFFWKRFQAPYSTISALFAITSLITGVGFTLAPKLSSALGPVRAVVLTQGISIAVLVALGMCYWLPLACMLYVVRNLLMNMCNPIASALLLGLVNEEERASANSIWITCWNVPNAVSRRLAGYLIKHYSFEAPFFLCAILYASSTLLFYVFFKRFGAKKPKPTT